MAFMEPQIEFGLWYVVDHDHRDFIPVDVVGALPLLNKLGDTIDLDSEEANVPNGEGETPADAIRAALKDYVDTTQPERITQVELRTGYGARLSAPGYMDCTDWSLFDTEEEAEVFLREEMGEEPDEEEDFEEGNRTEAEPENLDGMMVESLAEWVDANPNHPAIAYGRVKLNAMRARIAGDITRALALEQECDRIYNALPDECRW